MLKLVGFELFKMFRRPRTYLGYAACLLINICITLGGKYGDLGQEFGRQAGHAGFMVSGSPLNAEFMSWIVVGSPIASMILIMFVPSYVCLVYGEIFAGEVAEGTLRTVLVRPVGRGSFFVSKFLAGVVYALSLSFWLGISSYLLGWIFFGRGGLLATGTISQPVLAWYPEATGLWRLALGYLLICAGMVTVGMIALLISTWLNNSLGAVGVAMVLLFMMVIVGQIPWFKPIKDYLFSTHLLLGQQAFVDPLPWREIGFSLRCLGVYTAGLFAISYLIFRRKDILA